MLKKTITFTNFDDEEVTEEFHFNLTKAELLELDLKYDGGLEGFAKRISESKDPKEVYKEFKDLLLITIGRRVGNSFVKNDQIREEFLSGEAYSELLLEMLNDTDQAVAFFNGIMPAAVRQEVAKQKKGMPKPKPVMPLTSKRKPKTPPQPEVKTITRAEAEEMDSSALTEAVLAGAKIVE